MKLLLTTLMLLCTGIAAFSQANTKLSNLVSPTAVNQSLLPSSTNTKDLGTSSLAWKNLYLRNYVYLDGTRFVSNHPGTGWYNAFLGSNAGVAVTSGKYNSALGHYALYNDTSGSYNTAVGAYSMYNNTSSYSNTAVGAYALYANSGGYSNTAIGVRALSTNSTGFQNIGMGDSALFSNTTGIRNVALGVMALKSNLSGNNNVALGFYALRLNSSGTSNTAIGINALGGNGTGTSNTALGLAALEQSSTGSYNTSVGGFSLSRTRAAQYNTAIGYGAGGNNDNGYNNVFVGANADAYSPGLYNVIVIGQQTVGTAPSQVTIGNSATNSYRSYAYWSNISDGRYKKNLREDVPGLSFINKLRPVTYTLDASGLDAFLNKGRGKENGLSPEAEAVMQKARKEKEAIVETGFIAQEVEQAAKELKYNFSGVEVPKSDKDVYALRYAEFVVPLVKAVQELDSANTAKSQQINDQQKQIDELRQIVLELKSGSTNDISSVTGYLEQNIPNPTTNSTTIRYYVPTGSSYARLTLTNAKGQVIRTIAISSRGAGQLNLNLAGLAAGTYNYTLYVDGKQADNKRLVIAR